MAIRNKKFDTMCFTERKYNIGIIEELRVIAYSKNVSLTALTEEMILKYLDSYKHGENKS